MGCVLVGKLLLLLPLSRSESLTSVALLSAALGRLFAAVFLQVQQTIN